MTMLQEEKKKKKKTNVCNGNLFPPAVVNWKRLHCY